jgi:putative peptidoglycan lipid II flippase
MRVAGIPEIVGVTVAVSRRLGLSKSTTLPETTEIRSRTPYDPLMDDETMILPAIRANPFGTTGAGEFPYPVRQRETGLTAPAPAPEGVRVSDDAATGLPTGRPRADAAAGAGVTGTVGPASARGIGGPDEDRDHVAAQNSYEGAPYQGGYGQTPEYGRGRAEAAESGADGAEHGSQAVPPGPGEHAAAMVGAPGTPGAYPHAMPDAGHRSPRGPELIPGASVAGGRYRLLAAHGGSRGLVFWQALDIKLDREVALTFVDADQRAAQNQGEDGPQAILSRTLRLGRISSPGLARVLDVVRGSSGGIVVAEWTPGRSLREMAETRPSPIGAARAIASLAQAAELAHRSGGALSIDHPDRIRISVAGDAVLAFPGTLADSDVPSDVRGIGAMLYALILARWPLGGPAGAVTGTAAPNVTVGGLRLADYTSAGTPLEPRAIRPEVPFEISAVAVRALEPNQGVRTAATLQHVLEQASVVDQKTEMLPSLRVGQRAARVAAATLSDPEALAAEQARSKRMMLILVGLGALILLVLGLIGWWLATLFAGGGNTGPLSSANIGLTTSSAPTSQAAAEPTESGDAGSLVGGVPVPASDVSVFSPEGTPDDAADARNILNNSPSSQWRTDTYRQQFPALKSGLGLLATLPNPARLTSVSIDSPSAGTAVQVRSAPTDSPTLDQTQIIGSATLGQGVTKIPVKTDQPIRYVLIWITQLAPTTGGQYQSSLADVSFTASA